MNNIKLPTLTIDFGGRALGNYITTDIADTLIDYLVTNHHILDTLKEADGYRHLGTKFSQQFKSLYPSLENEELLYLESKPEYIGKLRSIGVSVNSKALKCGETKKYIQFISMPLFFHTLVQARFIPNAEYVSQYLNHIFYEKSIKVDFDDVVAGNKPVNIQDKPLFRIQTQADVDTEENLPPLPMGKLGLCCPIDKDDAMVYVKTSVQLRKDLYKLIKITAATQNRNMYDIIEECIVNSSYYNVL